MADILDLVNVQFADETSYVNIDNQDILGCMIDYHWGPANQLLVLDKQRFFELYPESVPVGAAKVDPTKYVGYAQIKKAFDMGISRVEVLRLCLAGKWQYQQINISSVSQVTARQHNDQFDDQSPISISSLYPGYVPQSMLLGYNNIAVRVNYTAATKDIKIEVLGVSGPTNSPVYSVIEEFEGSILTSQYDDGQNINISALCENSQYIRVSVNEQKTAPSVNITASVTPFVQFNATQTSEYLNPQGADNSAIAESLERFYDDFDLSSCTLLISPYCFGKKTVDNFDTVIQNIAERRKNLNAVLGYPVEETFTLSGIENFLTGQNAPQKLKFTNFVVGRELVQVFGTRVEINCTGGWCGCTAKIAKDVRLNQLASARTYGSYSGTLTKSLQFGDVLQLHDTYGVISVYQTKQGPQIFGVRTLYKRQTSYFGKANVMRVIANMLKNVFPIVLDAIHTDVAANQISMNALEVSLQSVIDDLIANQNLRPQSKAICDSTINNDYTTRGGTVLNVLLSCWFIGLTERINIKVVATDSSVTAEIVE